MSRVRRFLAVLAAEGCCCAEAALPDWWDREVETYMSGDAEGVFHLAKAFRRPDYIRRFIESMQHELKTWPEPFRAILAGHKRHEVRKNDRNFAVGDNLALKEFDPHKIAGPGEIGMYTGRVIFARVDYISFPGTFGLPDDLCVMSITVLSQVNEVSEAFLRSHIEEWESKQNVQGAEIGL